MDVVMPRLSDSMEEGTILRWLVEAGTAVRRGQAIVEIETDKATLTHEAEADGALEIVAGVGETLATGAVIARIAESADAPAVERTVAERTTARGDVTRIDLSRPQQVVARRAAEAKATVPELVLEIDVDLAAATALRDELAADGGVVPAFDDMVVRACALALRDVPQANSAYRDGRFELYDRVNVGVTVPAQDALVVPTIFDADRRGLRDVAAATRALAERVRSGEITPPELSGGTFTVSSLAEHGVPRFTAVINPPQAAILAVGAPVERVLPAGVRPVMTLTLTCDHRILYGAEAARFLDGIRARLEAPEGLVAEG